MATLDLLPPNATQFERDLATGSDFLNETETRVPRIRTAKRIDIPDDVVPWLIYEYGLGELLPYLPDPRVAIAEGVLWQRYRGTPAAIKTALGWIDFNAKLEESEAGTIRWAQYQLGLDKAPDYLEFVENVIGITRLSSPARSELFRVYGGWYDYRRFRLNEHLLSEGSWLCDHTGVYLKDDWPQLSFGREFASPVAPHELTSLGSREHIEAELYVYEDRFILSQSPIDEFWHLLQESTFTTSRLHFSILPATAWDIDEQKWGTAPEDWNVTQTWRPFTLVPELQYARAGVYLSDYAVLGDTNCCLPCRDEQEFGDGPFTLSEGNLETGENLLSQHIQRWEYEEINERFERQTATELQIEIDQPVFDMAVDRYHRKFIQYEDHFWLDYGRLDEDSPYLLESAATVHSTTVSHYYNLPILDWGIAEAATWTLVETGDGEFVLDEADPQTGVSTLDQHVSTDSWINLTEPAGSTWQDAGQWTGTFGSMVPELTFAKAGIYLSDSDPLGEINSVLAVRLEDEFGDGAFQLSEPVSQTGESVLSEHRLRWEYLEVTERLGRQTASIVATYSDGGVEDRAVSRATRRLVRYEDHFWLDYGRLDEDAPSLLESATTIHSTAISHLYNIDATDWGAADAPVRTLVEAGQGEFVLDEADQQTGDSTLDQHVSTPVWVDVAVTVQTTWRDAGRWDGTFGSMVPPRTFAKAGIYLSDDCVLDETDTAFSVREWVELGQDAFVLDEPIFATGDSALDEHVSSSQWAEITKRIERKITSVVQPYDGAIGLEASAVWIEQTITHELLGTFALSSGVLDEEWHSTQEGCSVVTATSFLEMPRDHIGWSYGSWMTANDWTGRYSIPEPPWYGRNIGSELAYSGEVVTERQHHRHKQLTIPAIAIAWVAWDSETSTTDNYEADVSWYVDSDPDSWITEDTWSQTAWLAPEAVWNGSIATIFSAHHSHT